MTRSAADMIKIADRDFDIIATLSQGEKGLLMNSDEAHLDNYLLVIQMSPGEDILFGEARRCLPLTLGRPWCWSLGRLCGGAENAAPEDLPEW